MPIARLSCANRAMASGSRERFFGDELDGNRAAEPGMHGLVNRSHAAGADLLAEFVARQRLLRMASDRHPKQRRVFIGQDRRNIRRATQRTSWRLIDGDGGTFEHPNRSGIRLASAKGVSRDGMPSKYRTIGETRAAARMRWVVRSRDERMAGARFAKLSGHPARRLIDAGEG